MTLFVYDGGVGCTAGCNPECKYEWLDKWTGERLGSGGHLSIYNVSLSKVICQTSNYVGKDNKTFPFCKCANYDSGLISVRLKYDKQWN